MVTKIFDSDISYTITRLTDGYVVPGVHISQLNQYHSLGDDNKRRLSKKSLPSRGDDGPIERSFQDSTRAQKIGKGLSGEGNSVEPTPRVSRCQQTTTSEGWYGPAAPGYERESEHETSSWSTSVQYSRPNSSSEESVRDTDQTLSTPPRHRMKNFHKRCEQLQKDWSKYCGDLDDWPSSDSNFPVFHIHSSDELSSPMRASLPSSVEQDSQDEKYQEPPVIVRRKVRSKRRHSPCRYKPYHGNVHDWTYDEESPEPRQEHSSDSEEWKLPGHIPLPRSEDDWSSTASTLTVISVNNTDESHGQAEVRSSPPRQEPTTWTDQSSASGPHRPVRRRRPPLYLKDYVRVTQVPVVAAIKQWLPTCLVDGIDKVCQWVTQVAVVASENKPHRLKYGRR